jgi:nucleoside-diphosphate-sugar epimerase
MKALVTGGGGFVGKALVKALLARGDEVVAFQRGEYPELSELGATVVRGDITDADAIRDACAGVDVVFHVAAKVGFAGKDEDFERINVGGTQNVIDACLANDVTRLIYCSTPSVALQAEDVHEQDESAPYADEYFAAYPRTKAQAEQSVLAADGSEGAGGAKLRSCALRPHFVFGPGDRAIFPRVFDRVRKGRLRILGDGENVVDACYIDNAVHAHLQAAQALAADDPRPAGKPYFITNGEPFKLWPFINDVLAGVGLPPLKKSIPASRARFVGKMLDRTWSLLGLESEPPITEYAVNSLSTSHTYKLDNARRDLDYKPIVGFEEARDRTIPWLKQEVEAGRM